jgi:hypothetical protein
MGSNSGLTLGSGGNHNVFIGNGSGQFLNGVNSIFIGSDAGKGVDGVSLNQNWDNVGIGRSVMTGLTIGRSNVGLGHLNSQYMTSGSNNVSVGKLALRNNTTANNNTAIGTDSLINSTGNNNTSLGSASGRNATTNANCTYLGFNSGIDVSGNTWTHSTAIGQNSLITASNQIVLGGLNSTTLPTVFIPSGRLTLGGTYRTGTYDIDLIGNINTTTGYFDNGVNINTIYQPIALMTDYYTKSQIDTSLVNYQPVSGMSNYSQLAGNNTWTGNNAFNTNLPTSTLTPTLSTQFITKAFADATYTTSGNILGSNNIWTGTNQFNNNFLVNSTTITPTEISRLSGISSNIQTQLNTINSNFSNYQTTAGMTNYMPLSGTVTNNSTVYNGGVNIFAGRNTTTMTGNLDNFVGCHIQWNRVNSNGQTFFMNRIASGSNNNGGFRFQRYNASSVYIDEPVTILDSIALNKNTAVTGTFSTSGLLTASGGLFVSGSVTGLSKTHVALDQVDNTSDLNKPISTATQTALNLKANVNNPTFTGTVSGITKNMVGLDQVDNTSDTNKPISSATQTALNSKANTNNATFSGTTTTNFLTSNGLLTANAGITLPATQNFNMNGNIITNTTPARTITPDEIACLDGITSNIQVQINNKANTNSPTFTGTVSGITKTMVGLGQVDNTSDINKPISSAVQSALDLILEKTDMITVNGLNVEFPSEVHAPAFVVGGTNIDVKFLSNTDANSFYLKKVDAQNEYGRLSIMNTWTNFNTFSNRVDMDRTRVNGRNNATATATGFVENVSGLHLQHNRNDDGITNIMNHKGTASGNGGFKFQRFDGTGNYIDDVMTIADSATINKNTTINGSLTTTSGIVTTGVTATTGNITTLTNTTLNTVTVNTTNTNGTTANFTTYRSNNYPLTQSLVCGYILDGPNASKGPYLYHPILCSTARTVVNVDDVIVVYPGYKIVMYVDANYTGTSGVCNNYLGTTPQSYLTSSVLGSANSCDSVKVFYLSDSNEVTIQYIS